MKDYQILWGNNIDELCDQVMDWVDKREWSPIGSPFVMPVDFIPLPTEEYPSTQVALSDVVLAQAMFNNQKGN